MKKILITVLFLILVSTVAWAETAALNSDADTYFRAGHGPYGGDSYMWCASGSYSFVGYLRFDLSGLGSINITDATMTLHTVSDKQHDSIVSGRFAVYGLANGAGNTAQDWDESTLTSANAGDEWDVDYSFADSLSEGRVINLDADQGANVTEVVPNSSSGTCTLSGADLVSFLQTRVDDDGLATLIITMRDSNVKYTSYGTKEADAAYRPVLEITYTPSRLAYSPNPADKSTVEPNSVTLSWTPGDGAVSSKVYFGTDSNDMSSAYLGATTGNTFDPGTLAPATTYVWRVDTVTGNGIKQGPLWRFQTTLPPMPAFPGAEGFGAMANGGRGGDVYTVTNLNSSGKGSLVYGIENAPAAGRTIVFAVSGYIPITNNSHTGDKTILIDKNNITIAGQTAPGDGIGLKDGRIYVTGNNVVLRYLRIRHGKYGGAGDCLNLASSATNTMIDHISLMFSTDENISFFKSSLDNFTMQYCTSSWGMERHNAGGLWDLIHGTCHHCLWAHHRTRNPKARPYGLLEWINNVTFHWRSEGFIMGDSESNVDWYANVIGCYYISIPDYGSGLDSTPLSKARIASDGKPNFHLYLNDTLIDDNGDGVLNGTDQGYAIVSGWPYDPYEGAPAGTVRYDKSSKPFTGDPNPVTIDDPLTAYKKVISSAGALRLDATYSGPLRDELDTLLINSVENQESILVAKDSPVTTNPEEPPKNGEQHLADAYGIPNHGFGTLNTAAAPTDTDGDGMPDFWELAIGSDATLPNNNDLVAAGAYVSLGYTLLDEYLDFCAIPHAVIPMRSASQPSSLSVDLRKYTRGFNVAPVVFSVSDIQNGSATIQSDGTTVVFEPALDFSGRARFDFTVTDGDGSTWTQTLAVLVDPTEYVTLPNQLSWNQVPTAAGLTAITMSAPTLPGLDGVEYYFTALSTGGHDSGWQSNPTYTDTGLTPATSYTYTVKARLAGNSRDETQASEPKLATTDAMPALPDPAAYPGRRTQQHHR